MKKLTIKEMRQSLSHLDRLLEIDGEVTITRLGEAIARLRQIQQSKADHSIFPTLFCPILISLFRK